MPLIKELEDLLPFVRGHGREVSAQSRKGFAPMIVFDGEAKTMTWQERSKLFLMDYHKRSARKPPTC